MRLKDRMQIARCLTAGLALMVLLCAAVAWADEVAVPAKDTAPPEPDLTPGKRTITVAADQPLGECYRFWTVGNFNKPHVLLDPAAVKAYREVVPFVTELNLVYFLGGRYVDQNCWFLGVGPDGKIRTDFTGMIAQLKAALAYGYTPRIVLDNVPYNMSDPPQENFYGNTSPPKDERIWHQYVEAAMRAMVEAFGRETVASWWFRVGTEPDLTPGHWAGTREQYFAHYDYTVDAVDRVLPGARIGPGNILNPGAGRNPRAARAPGPGRRRWGMDVIDHVASGTNACTGKKGSRMTVFSCSWYAKVGNPVSHFDGAMNQIRERLALYPQFADVAIEAGEFAVLRDDNGRRLYAGETTEWSASFFAALADRVYALGIRHLYEWDHATGGILHPRGHVIAMMERMAGGQRLAVNVKSQSAANCGALACRKGHDVFVLLYNHRPLRRHRINEAVHLVIEDRRMKAGDPWRLSEWTLDHTRGVWAYAFEADCEAAGIKPLPGAGLHEGNPLRLFGEPGEELFRRNLDKYARLSVMPQTKNNVPAVVGDGRLALDLEMSGHSVRLLQLSPAE